METTHAASKKNGAHAAPPPALIVQEIPLDDISPSPLNHRKIFRGLEELARSIEGKGVRVPVKVRPLPDGRHELVYGERRWRASQLAGRATIPAIVQAMTDLEVLEEQLLENVQRADVHPLEEADGYRALMKDHGYTVDQIAAKTGKSRAAVYARLKLCELAAAPRKAFLEDKLSPSVALLIARIADAKLQDEALGTLTAGRKIWVEGKEIVEPLSYREASAIVQERFMLRLERAPFPIGDADLVPEAGSCTKCPHRTGNQRELFSDVKSADLCTKPSCFAMKKDADWKRKTSEAEEKGLRVLSAKEAKQVFPKNGTATRADSPYVGLADELPYDLQEATGAKTWKSLLGKAAPEKVLARDATGATHELVDKQAALEAARKAGKLPEEKGATRKTKAQEVDWKEQQRRDAEKRELARTTARIALGQIADGVATALNSTKKANALWAWVARTVLASSDEDSLMLVALRRGHTVGTDYGAAEKILAAEVEAAKNDEVELIGLIVEVLAAFKAAPSWGTQQPGDTFRAACELFDVDLKEAKAAAAAHMKAAKKIAAELAAESGPVAPTKAKKGGKS